MKRFLVVAVFATASLVMSACGSNPTATPTLPATPPITPQATDPIAAGYAAYWDAGCATCHGQNAEGRLGPPLAGASRNVVINKVRYSSSSIMPSFSKSELSDADLDLIATYLLSLDASKTTP